MHLPVNNSRKGKIEYLIIFRTKKEFLCGKNSTTRATKKNKIKRNKNITYGKLLSSPQQCLWGSEREVIAMKKKGKKE